MGPVRQKSTTPEKSTVPNTTPHFVFHPRPDYPWNARQQGLEGVVTLTIEMRADGTVGEVQVARSSGSSVLDDAARQAVQQWTHTPATRNGRPITQWASQEIYFTLPKTTGQTQR
jgi:protein TonB